MVGQGFKSAANFKFEFGPWALIVLLFIVGVLISSLYLMHFNKVATKGYDIRKLEAERQILLTQNGIKDISLSEMKSLKNIIQNERLQSMRKPSTVVFVKSENVLASR